MNSKRAIAGRMIAHNRQFHHAQLTHEEQEELRNIRERRLSATVTQSVQSADVEQGASGVAACPSADICRTWETATPEIRSVAVGFAARAGISPIALQSATYLHIKLCGMVKTRHAHMSGTSATLLGTQANPGNQFVMTFLIPCKAGEVDRLQKVTLLLKPVNLREALEALRMEN